VSSPDQPVDEWPHGYRPHHPELGDLDAHRRWRERHHPTGVTLDDYRRIRARRPSASETAAVLEMELAPWALGWDDDPTEAGARVLHTASRVLRRGGVDITTVAAIIELARLSDGEWFDEVDRLVWDLVAAILAHLDAPRNRAERRHGCRLDVATSPCATTRADPTDDHAPAVLVRELVAAPAAPPA
jgi:hypothetical protein